jgi:hypothetical protein
MVMVIHQAVGVAQPVKSPNDLGERAQEQLAVGIVFENGFAFVAAGGEVIERSVEFNP